MQDASRPAKPTDTAHTPARKAPARTAALEIEDGRQAMHKIFVESKIITAADFDLCWTSPDLSSRPPMA